MYFHNRFLQLDVSQILEIDHVPRQFHYFSPKTYNYTCFLDLISGTVSILEENNVSYLIIPSSLLPTSNKSPNGIDFTFQTALKFTFFLQYCCFLSPLALIFHSDNFSNLPSVSFGYDFFFLQCIIHTFMTVHFLKCNFDLLVLCFQPPSDPFMSTGSHQAPQQSAEDSS